MPLYKLVKNDSAAYGVSCLEVV